MLRRLGTATAVLLAVALGGLLLWPNGEQVRLAIVEIYLVGLHHGVPSTVGPERYAQALNVLAFVPLGWLGVASLRRHPVLVVGVLGSASVLAETAQLLPVLHRVPSVIDVVCNTSGAVLGAVAASLLLQHPRGDEAADEVRDVSRDDVG